MTKPAKRRRSPKRRPDFFLKNRYLLMLMVAAGLLVGSLVFLSRQTELPAPAPQVPPAAKPAPVDDRRLLLAEVEAFLGAINAGADVAGATFDQGVATYTVTADFPSAEQVEGLVARLQGVPGDYAVQLHEANSLAIDQAGRVSILIKFLPIEPPLPEGPLLAIIMDDLGRSTYPAKVLLSMAQPVTFAILPGEAEAVKIAEMAYAAGHEVMLHAPMEPQGYPAVNPGQDALFIKDSSAEIRQGLDRFLARIPHVTGVNNHMGSRFTEDVRALTPVMESLQEKGLFFIDSRTTGHSRVTEVAQRFGVPTMNRDVFLDNVAEVEAIAREIGRLEGKARRQGMAIGICHPYPETLEALKRELAGVAERGVRIVPVSVLLRKQALIQGS